jgi:hypothetical protein
MSENRTAHIREAIDGMDYQGKFVACEPLGNGHINDTFKVTCDCGGTLAHYTLQRINTGIFRDPEALMRNICGVTEHLKKKIAAAGGDVRRETINLVRAKDGRWFYRDSAGGYWKSYHHIDGVTCYDLVTDPRDFYECGFAFGNFLGLLADYPAETLAETIPDFHNTPKRYLTFERAVAEDVKGRAASVAEEIAFVRARRAFMSELTDRQASGELPLRVTHNDTKINNAMIDDATGRAICIIDLDTVMPGLPANDFGDSIRFGASTGAEDERDLSKVHFSLPLYEQYAKGFLAGCDGRLTKAELASLPIGAKMMTLECGMRFLTDYLQGDTYFRIHREGHNLDRCRTQFRLVDEMERNWEQMYRIIEKYSEK